MDWRTYVSSVLLITGLVGAAVFLGGRDPKTGLPDPITVGGVTHTFTYTDETAKEDLIIYTDKEVYSDGFSGATMYLAVVNNSGVGQDIELSGYFVDDKRRIKDVSILSEITTERYEPVYEERCEEVATTTEDKQASTTRVCESFRTGTSTIQETRNVWVPLSLTERTPAEILKENMLLSSLDGGRKSVGDYDAKRKSSPFFLPTDGVLYYRIGVEFPPQGSTNMLIEAVGSQGGYGFIN